MTTWQAVALVVAALLGGGGLGSLAGPLLNRRSTDRRTRIEAADVLTDSVLQYAEAVKVDAAQARADAEAVRAEVAAARRELAEVRAEAHALGVELRQLRLAILAPSATLDGLRSLVRADPTTNGR